MKTKLVKRHYCDHCGKGGFQIPAMRKHESGCTLNPARVCRMCEMAGEVQVDIATLIASQKGARFGDCTDEVSKEKDLRELCHNCPACILATIRQSPGCFPITFNFKAECKEFFDKHRTPSDYGMY